MVGFVFMCITMVVIIATGVLLGFGLLCLIMLNPSMMIWYSKRACKNTLNMMESIDEDFFK